MPEKNESKTDKKELSQNQKKPLPQPDPNLRQVMYKREQKEDKNDKK
jgi:hypothetical protein